MKTGETPAHFEQLMVYSALASIEYKINPKEYKYILKIYQNFEQPEFVPESEDIERFMNLIKEYDNRIQLIKGAIK